ncbi:MAG: CBS domain-containing protein [Flavobacteriaceae bacterium]|nr:CBS domain-containing protein [Flavobacteriaceae bacterium]
MQTSDYITKDVKALKLGTTVRETRNLFNRLTFTHLPVVEKKIYLGCISEADVSTIDDEDRKISDLRYLLDTFFVDENTNWFDLLKEFAVYDTTIIPVINSDKKYVGYFELSDILQVFNHTPFLNEPGAILVVSKPVHDYSFSEIAQIIESNKGKLLGAFVSKIEDEIAEITIKLNDLDLNNTIQSFRRYEYTILTGIHEDEYLKSLKERSEYLQKYLNI